MQELVALIVEVLEGLNGSHETHVGVEANHDTPLFGQNGILDSLGLVSLVVAVEQAIEDRFGVSVSLADEKAMSQKSSPYRTIGTLAAYASRVMQEEIHNE